MFFRLGPHETACLIKFELLLYMPQFILGPACTFPDGNHKKNLDPLKLPGRFNYFIQLCSWLFVHCNIDSSSPQDFVVLPEVIQAIDCAGAQAPTAALEILDSQSSDAAPFTLIAGLPEHKSVLLTPWCSRPCIASISLKFSSILNVALVRRLVELCPYSESDTRNALSALCIHLVRLDAMSPPLFPRVTTSDLLADLNYYLSGGTEENGLVCLSIIDGILRFYSASYAAADSPLQQEKWLAQANKFLSNALSAVAIKFLDIFINESQKYRLLQVFGYLQAWFTDDMLFRSVKNTFVKIFMIPFCLHGSSLVRSFSMQILRLVSRFSPKLPLAEYSSAGLARMMFVLEAIVTSLDSFSGETFSHFVCLFLFMHLFPALTCFFLLN